MCAPAACFSCSRVSMATLITNNIKPTPDGHRVNVDTLLSATGVLEWRSSHGVVGNKGTKGHCRFTSWRKIGEGLSLRPSLPAWQLRLLGPSSPRGTRFSRVQRPLFRWSSVQVLLLSSPASFPSDAAQRSGFVCTSCRRLCQIKGHRLDSEATLLFILVQPRERSNNSRGNVVTGEAERSLPTGRGKWREALSLKSSLLHIFASKCHFQNQVMKITPLRSPLIRSPVVLCLPRRGFLILCLALRQTALLPARLGAV